MTFSDFSITVSKRIFLSKMEESSKFVCLFAISYTEPDFAPMVFIN